MIEKSLIHRRPDCVYIKEKKTRKHLFYFSPDYKGLDPFSGEIPEETRRLSDDVMKYKQVIKDSLVGSGGRHSWFGTKNIHEVSGMGISIGVQDLERRTPVDLVETQVMDEEVAIGTIAQVIYRYNLYENGVGTFQKIYKRDRFTGPKKGRIIEHFVLEQHFLTVGDMPAIDEIVKYYLSG
jgi:hypothetical protein